MDRKKLKVSHNYPKEHDFCKRLLYRGNFQVVLSDLPNEILLKIFSYLNCLELARISDLNIPRLTELTLDLSRIADFSVCNTIQSTDIHSFFIKERRDCIQEINFNNVYSVLPSILNSCIKKCKNITKLYVNDCGLSWYDIEGILKSCQALEELYWSVPDHIEEVNFEEELDVKSNSIKKLCIQLRFVKGYIQNVLRIIILCPAVENIYLNYSTDYITSIPAKLSTTNFCFKYMFSLQNGQKQNILPMHVFLKCPDRVVQLLIDSNDFNFTCPGLRTYRELRELNVIDIDSISENLIHHSSSFLQIMAQEKYLVKIPSLPKESVKSMVITMNHDIKDIFSHTERIMNMTGNALEHLAFYKYLPYSSSFSKEESVMICDLLGSFAAKSTNITVLCLSELHLGCTLPFDSLCVLKRLKVLSLTSCCMSDVQTSKMEGECHSFKNFAINCTKVEEFGIYGCKSCKLGPSEKTLVSISLWKELKSLTLKELISIRLGQFFKNIADNCPKLKSVEVFSLGVPTVCHFIPNFAHILRKSTELTFLRLNQPGFYPKEPLFWNEIRFSTNLQGLCLSSNIDTYIENRPIIEAIKELPHLHLFHFVAKRTSQNLKTQVKRVLAGNAVKHFDIFIDEQFKSSGVCVRVGSTSCELRHLAI